MPEQQTPLADCTVIQKHLLAGQFQNPDSTLTRLKSFLESIDSPLKNGAITFDLRADLKKLNQMGLVFVKVSDGENYFYASLSAKQLYAVSQTEFFPALLMQVRKSLRLVYRHELYRVSEMQQTLMARLLAGYMLLGKLYEYNQSIQAFENYDSFPLIRQNAFLFLAGKLDHFPSFLNDALFGEMFPFLSWHATIIGGSADKLIRKYDTVFPGSVQTDHIDDWVMMMLWHGRSDRLKQASGQGIRLADGALAFLQGKWDEAYTILQDRIDKAVRTMSRTRLNPLLLLTSWLAGIRSLRGNSELRAYPEDVRSNTALQNHGDQAVFLSSLLTSLDAVSRSGAKMETPCEPERLPVFCNVLKAVFLARTRKQALPEKTANAYLALLQQLENQKQNLTACWLSHALAVLADKDSFEWEYAQNFSNKFPELQPFNASGAEREPWENVLESFRNVLENLNTAVPQAAVETEPPYTISWLLSAQPCGNGVYMLDSIQLRKHTLASDGTKSKGHIVPARDFAEGACLDCMTQEERSIRSCIQTTGGQSSIPLSAIEKLAGNPRVCLNESGVPLVLHRGTNSIETLENPDGSLRISLRFRWRGSGCTVYLYRENDDSIGFVLADPAMKRLNSFFESTGKNGAVTVPPSAREKVLETLAPAVRQLPVGGVLEQDLLSSLPEEKGQTALFLRIRESISGTLLFELKNHPLPDVPALAVTPGQDPEIVSVRTDHGMRAVRRDLKQEQDAFCRFLEACPSLAAVSPPLNHEPTWECESFSRSLPILAEIQDSGIPVEWSGTQNEIRELEDNPRSMNLTVSSGEGGWFTIGGTIRLDKDRVLAVSELLDMMKEEQNGFLPLGQGKYVRIKGDLLTRLETLRAAGTVQDDGKLICSPAALPMFASEMPGLFQDQLHDFRDKFDAEFGIPENFKKVLRPYQAEGFRYLSRMASVRFGCCLADDMGLGKTIQLLALIQSQAQEGAALVVAPASVCRNWEAEARRFTTNLHVTVLRNQNREEIIRQAAAGDLIIVSYGLLLSEEKLFADRTWHTVVLDEAQNIKNNTARRTRAVRNLRADIRIAATGTPIENRLQELWSIFDFLNPGLLGEAKVFEAKYCHQGASCEGLRRLVSPLILRRLKKDVLADLPDKIETTVEVELAEQERELYEALRQEALQKLKQGGENRIAILAQLTKLRQACCHPSLIAPDIACEGSKLRQITELAQDLKESGHKVLIFSQFVRFLELIRGEFAKRNLKYQYLDGATPPDERQKRVDRFQSGNGDFFLISLKAGGTGLNLTAADYVILCDPWWNPATEAQASDRAHRIGQKNTVTVYRMVCTDTVEEKVLTMHEQKRSLAESILSDSTQADITSEEMMSLFE